MAATRSIGQGPGGLLRITSLEQGTTSTLEYEGEWDLAQSDAARAAIARALKSGPECLVLDLSRLVFIDSTGVHALIDAQRRCAEQDTRLVVIPGPRAVQHVFEICGLLELLPFSTEAGSAVEHAPSTTAGQPGGALSAPDGAVGR